ncbi:hypothetical protein F5876DRAFT_42287, partial [Lentinula aff. lateritia]
DNIDWNYYRWISPGEGDLRSPCRALNILANHGFISRDGKNITIQMVFKAADGTSRASGID